MAKMQAQPTRQVLWLQVYGLAAVQGAIALTWVIYNLYLRQLLIDFGFPAPLASALLIGENLLAVVMEPLMGSFSDRVQRWVGSRFPFIASGIILASGCFILIPAVLVFGPDQGPLRLLLPSLMVAWAIAMTVFRSPALSLLGRYAFATRLPQAASILTLVGGVAGAMGPLANQLILGIGPLFAFGLGSIVLLAAAAALQWADPSPSVAAAESAAAATSSIPLSPVRLGLVFGTGVGIALGFRLLMYNFPQVIATRMPEANQGLILGAIFIALALTAIPAGTLAVRLGNRRAMGLGLIAMALACGLIPVSYNAWIATAVAILSGASFSLVANGTIPFALSMVPADKGGLGTGIYFSGGALATSAFVAVVSNAADPSPAVVALGGTIAFLAAAGLIGASAAVQTKA